MEQAALRNRLRRGCRSRGPALMLALELALRRDPDHVPGEPELLEDRDHERRGVEQPLPPTEAVACRPGEGVVVVMPRLAERGQREPGDVRRMVVGLETAGAEEVAQRVDAPGDVVHEEDPHEPAPEQAASGAGERAREGPAGEGGDGEAEQHEQRELPVDGPHARVLVEVLGVAARAGTALGREQPARVCVPEPAEHSGHAVAVADVGAVRDRPPRRCARGACGGRRPSSSPGPGRPSSRGRRRCMRAASAPGTRGG